MDTARFTNVAQRKLVSLYVPDRALVEKVNACKVTEETVSYVDIPYVLATTETLAGFGRLEDDFDKIEIKIEQWPGRERPLTNGDEAGVTEGAFVCHHEAPQPDGRTNYYLTNNAVKGHYHTGFRMSDDLFTDYANYHPDGEQAFCSPSKAPFVMVLSKRKFDDKAITPTDFVAFYFDGTKAVVVDSGVWHQGAYPVDRERLEMRTKQGKVHGVVEVLFQDEFGVHVRIPNAFSTVPPASMHHLYQNIGYQNGCINGYHVERPQGTYQPAPEILARVAQHTKVQNGHRFVDIPYVMATESSLRGYGKLVEAIHETDCEIVKWPSRVRPMMNGNEGGYVKGRFEVWWSGDQCLGSNHAVKDNYTTGFKHGADLFTHRANYHPDGGQTFLPVSGGPFIIILSKNKSDTQVTPMDFVAFYFDGSKGFCMDPGVWHQPPFPVHDAIVLDDMQGAVHARVEIAFVKEFDVHVRVPNFQATPAA